MMMKLQRSVVFGQVEVRSEAEGMQSRKLFAEGILWFAGRSLFSVISPQTCSGVSWSKSVGRSHGLYPSFDQKESQSKLLQSTA